MLEIWRQNIQQNHEIIRANDGPGLIVIVSGTELDRRYWKHHFTRTERDVFRANASAVLVSISEPMRKGNFLGMLRAWDQVKAILKNDGTVLPNVSLMSMVFGQGKRLSPFTQSLGNRKAALPTPMKGRMSGEYLCTADLSNLYANSWVQHLASCGFRGLVVKWGDEAAVPGIIWPLGACDYSFVDAFRFVWLTKPTAELARDKDWVVIDSQGRMQYQYARQSLDSLNHRLAADGHNDCRVGVNLGSLAISYQFLDLALEIFREDVDNPSRWMDWDPYVWMALFTQSSTDWEAESDQEERVGKQGIRQLNNRFPDFYAKVTRLRDSVRTTLGRPLIVSARDFGMPLWADMGLHSALRAGLCEIMHDSERGTILRDLYALPHERDLHGNLIINSEIPGSADIRDSVLLDTMVSDKNSVIHGGVLVGGRFRSVSMSFGGAALFSAADILEFTGPNAIALRSVAPSIRLPEGGRHATLFLSDGSKQMVTNESIVDYDGANYEQPILGNPMSFAEAAQVMSSVDGAELDHRWQSAWQTWPG
jgi:hypothetical protein